MFDAEVSRRTFIGEYHLSRHFVIAAGSMAPTHVIQVGTLSQNLGDDWMLAFFFHLDCYQMSCPSPLRPHDNSRFLQPQARDSSYQGVLGGCATPCHCGFREEAVEGTISLRDVNRLSSAVFRARPRPLIPASTWCVLLRYGDEALARGMGFPYRGGHRVRKLIE